MATYGYPSPVNEYRNEHPGLMEGDFEIQCSMCGELWDEDQMYWDWQKLPYCPDCFDDVTEDDELV